MAVEIHSRDAFPPLCCLPAGRCDLNISNQWRK